MMEEYLNQEIKEIITKFPEIEGILDEFEIGCGLEGRSRKAIFE